MSAHKVLAGVLQREQWTAARLSPKTIGAKEGRWGLSVDAEAFPDQLVIWRKLGFKMSTRRPDADRFARADTHDALWNAAQRQLLTEGRIQNFLRMLWGKKNLEWTATPRDALAVMIELNNRFAVDGRDANSYGGVFWVLVRYDRPWPERSVYGTIRCMTSDSTARKLRVKAYLRRYGPTLF